MKIETSDFVESKGAQFIITTDSVAELVLLWACVNIDEGTLKYSDYGKNKFVLTLPVSN